jgi:hypothetical protein
MGTKVKTVQCVAPLFSCATAAELLEPAEKKLSALPVLNCASRFCVVDFAQQQKQAA